MLACGALVFRRTHPIAVWLAVTVIAGLQIVATDQPSGLILVVLVALYTVAAHTRRALAVWTALASAVFLLSLFAGILHTGWLEPSVFAILAWCGMSAAVGDAARSHREIVQAAEERALRAEHSREEEALRRVAEDRVRIARDLHDVVAHNIAVINVQAGVTDHLMTSDPTQAKESLRHVRQASQQVLAEMTTMLGLLRTPADDVARQPAPGLDDIEILVETMREAGMQIKLTTSGTYSHLSSGLELTVYRLVQEALTNASKHGDRTAHVTLRFHSRSLVVEISNPMPRPDQHESGVVGESTGAPDSTADPDLGPVGHGLVGMRERVSASGGQLEVGRLGAKFVVRANFPLGGDLFFTEALTEEAFTNEAPINVTELVGDPTADNQDAVDRVRP